MNTEEMYTSINKGVPNYIILDIDITTLLNECASDKEQFIKEFAVLKELYRTNIIRICGNTKAQEFFFDKFRIITSYKTAESKIHISPIPFIEKLKSYLNISNSSIDFNDENLKRELLEKVEELKSITSPEELKQKFPEIYKDYELSTSSYIKIKKYHQKHSNNLTPEVKDVLNHQYNLYRNFALDTDFHVFIKKQSTMYHNLIMKRQFIEGYTNRNPIDFSMFTGLSKEKFELYLADKYLSLATKSDDSKVVQECIYYLATYIRETKTSELTIKNEEGKTVSFNQIIRRYRSLLKNNPLVKPIDEPRENFKGYHIRHVENHVKKYFFTNVNWEIVPPGTDDELDKSVITSLNRQYNYLSPEERSKKILERYAIYERKRKFFENSGYIYKIYGRNTFEGYVAYIYANGKVLMEKFYDDFANCIPTKGEAIYNVDVTTFEALSKLPKTVLIKDKQCKRIIHAGKWEEKGQKVIEQEPIPNAEEEIKKLILTIKKPNEK